MDSLAEGGTLLAVHWRRPVPFHPQTGDGAHAALARLPELTLLADHREPDFLAQVYLRAPAWRRPRGAVGGGGRGPDVTPRPRNRAE